jgi:hypothetical protein
LLDRLKARMHRNKCCDSCDSCNSCGSGCGTGCGSSYGTPVVPPSGEKIGPPKDPGKKLPEGGKEGGKVQFRPNTLDVTPTSSKTIETETKNPFELDRRYESRVGRAADFGWVTGQLFYVHADGGLWVLRYAPLWKEDPNGGSVVLARERSMDSYREGDLVKVHGEILKEKASIFLGGPLYRTQSIQLLDRAAK